MSFPQNNFSSPGNWRYGQENIHDYASSTYHNNNDSDRFPFFFPPNSLFRNDPVIHRVRDPWNTYEETVIRSPFSSFGFPTPPHPPPLRIIVPENSTSTTREVNYNRPRETTPVYHQSTFPRQNVPTGPPPQQQHPKTRHDERNNALAKLKREVYNPMPKKLSRRLSLYYRDKTNSNSSITNDDHSEEDGKRCAICLEDFEAKEMVMTTPCNHMFHEECIVPWVTSNGQCPVCRFLIHEPIRETNTAVNRNIDVGDRRDWVVHDLLRNGEIGLFIRAMEEAILLSNISR